MGWFEIKETGQPGPRTIPQSRPDGYHDRDAVACCRLSNWTGLMTLILLIAFMRRAWRTRGRIWHFHGRLPVGIGLSASLKPRLRRVSPRRAFIPDAEQAAQPRCPSRAARGFGAISKS